MIIKCPFGLILGNISEMPLDEESPCTGSVAGILTFASVHGLCCCSMMYGIKFLFCIILGFSYVIH
jgi:hypothetical protein